MNTEAAVMEPSPRAQLKSTQIEAARVDSSRQFDCVIGVSAHIAELKEFVGVQAAVFQPALLVGERGLRQEQIARALHQAGEHRDDPFFAVNVRAMNEDALHQLLFGSRGIVGNARRGAIYIDDLINLPPMLQSRFAAHIEEQRWGAQSGRKPLQRLVFATEYDSTARSAQNRLAHGLIEELRSSSFLLKPLRERSEDIPYLASHLVSRISRRLGKEEHKITHEATLALVEYQWEGNIDELEAVLESMIANAPPPHIDESMLPNRIRHAAMRTIPASGVNLPGVVDDYERALIETALGQTGGNQTKASQLLGLRLQTLNMKLKRYAKANRPIVIRTRAPG
ncbi:MAG TPA: sigma 54-interacting transcriptional regulator [Blastocatellia bacterium]|jgi:DNA-binding NtrC family response regulator